MFMGVVAAVAAGSSLAGTTLNALSTCGDLSVSCGIETSNLTKYPMQQPHVLTSGGRIKIPPVDILPGVKEAMVAHKTPICATGTEGVVSWVVKDRRVVVMWSAPFDFNIHDNWLAVGLTKPGHTHHEENWFDVMYKNKPGSAISYRQKKFNTDLSSVKISDGDFEVEGTMGSAHITSALISVKPHRKKDYAPSILKAMGTK